MSSFADFTDRAAAVTLRTYCRPLQPDDESQGFESWDQMIQRSTYDHHLKLWEEAGGKPKKSELDELKTLGLQRKSLVAGRTQWLGGTPYAYERACCQFNCAYSPAETVFDIVDIAWLLLNGSGVGFQSKVGVLHGFVGRPPELTILPSPKAAHEKGQPHNIEEKPTEANGWHWKIRIGDSAEAWAKAIGKLLAGYCYKARKLTIDGSNCRGPGGRLRGYGWICNGFQPLANCLLAIFEILSRKANNLLDEMDIGDIVNRLGEVLSSRRSAQIWLMDSTNPLADEFAVAKKDYFLCRDCGHYNTPSGICSRCGSRNNYSHRRQSNNTEMFWSQPTLQRILELLYSADECGGDPGILNAEGARRKAPWFQAVNPSLRAGTKVLTDKGIFPIEQLDGKDFHVPNLDNKWSFARCRLSGKNAKLWQITLSGGHVYHATKEHQWPVLLNGRYVKQKTTELRPGDLLPLITKEKLYDHDNGTYQDGFFLGWLLGDGWVTIRSDDNSEQIGLIVGEGDGEAKRELTDYLRKLGSKASFHPSSNGAKSEELQTSNIPISAVLRRFGWKGKESLPSCVWSDSSEDFRKGLIDALFSSDGCIYTSGRISRLSFSSSRESLVREVSELLGFYGIRTSVQSRTTKPNFPNGKTYDQTYQNHTLTVDQRSSLQHFASVFRFTLARKQEKLMKASAAKVRSHVFDGHVGIVSVIETNLCEDVWDVGVDDDAHCFHLSHCVTGNCGEILLGTVCNLVTNCLPRFRKDFSALERAVWLIARANYRQTCVNFRDEILQPRWQQTNEALRLCGISATGIPQSDWMTDYQIRRLRNSAINGSYSMADELGLPRPKAVTTIKPEGTGSKCMGSRDVGEIMEGTNRALGRYLKNWINYSAQDPIVSLCEEAGYKILPNPQDKNNVLICFPVEYKGSKFSVVNGKEVNLEPAVDQLDRYLRWNNLWADHNVSSTISYSPQEIPEIARWLDANWNNGFIATSFLRRNDPTKTAQDLGHPYLPQEVVGKEDFEEYRKLLRPVDWSRLSGKIFEVDVEGCASGVCPVR